MKDIKRVLRMFSARAAVVDLDKWLVALEGCRPSLGLGVFRQTAEASYARAPECLKYPLGLGDQLDELIGMVRRRKVEAAKELAIKMVGRIQAEGKSLA